MWCLIKVIIFLCQNHHSNQEMKTKLQNTRSQIDVDYVLEGNDADNREKYKNYSFANSCEFNIEY